MWMEGLFIGRSGSIVIVSLLIYLNLNVIDSTETESRQFALQMKETNTPNFVRLVIMRLIFGLAKSMGLADRLSGFLGGAFVPPGAEDYEDYGDYGDYGGDLF